MKNWKKDIFTIPNLLSLFRILLIPVYMVIYLHAEEPVDYYVAGGILTVSCLTDLIDGKIARHFNMISNTGRILDPLADKATQFTLIICLAVRYPALWLLIGLFIMKESFQLIAGIIILRHRKILSGALMSGKISTTVLFSSLILMVLIPEMSASLANILIGIDLLVMIVAFVDYVRVYRPHSSMIMDLDDGMQNKQNESLE